jgi:hypothetical protein
MHGGYIQKVLGTKKKHLDAKGCIQKDWIQMEQQTWAKIKMLIAQLADLEKLSNPRFYQPDLLQLDILQSVRFFLSFSNHLLKGIVQ